MKMDNHPGFCDLQTPPGPRARERLRPRPLQFLLDPPLYVHTHTRSHTHTRESSACAPTTQRLQRTSCVRAVLMRYLSFVLDHIHARVPARAGPQRWSRLESSVLHRLEATRTTDRICNLTPHPRHQKHQQLSKIVALGMLLYTLRSETYQHKQTDSSTRYGTPYSSTRVWHTGHTLGDTPVTADSRTRVSSRCQRPTKAHTAGGGGLGGDGGGGGEGGGGRSGGAAGGGEWP